MLKTKFKVDIHSKGDFNDTFIRIITHHNEGKVNVPLGIFLMAVKATYAAWPVSTPETTIKENVGAGTIEVIEGDKHTLTITECTYDELGEVGIPAENDLAVLEQVENLENISQQGDQC